ncbi:MAG: nucleotidyltransferase domain-containing protein [Sterolibacterium sp.]
MPSSPAPPEDVTAPDLTRTLVTRMRQELRDGQEALRASYTLKGNAAAMLRGRAMLVDNALRQIWRHLSLPKELCLAAVGGYGRGELFPGSDVDVLLLLPDGLDDQHDAHIEQTIGLLWDIGLEVGHSVRSIAECIEEAQRDITIQTSLLEARLLEGNRKTFTEFTTRLRDHLDPQAFFKAKQLEQEERYARHNDTAYSLEPNCKESPGGFRDLQIIRGSPTRPDRAAPGANWPGMA